MKAWRFSNGREIPLVPTEEGVAVVHIRRAHMRVLYERISGAVSKTPQAVPSQALLIRKTSP